MKFGTGINGANQRISPFEGDMPPGKARRWEPLEWPRKTMSFTLRSSIPESLLATTDFHAVLSGVRS